MFQRTRDVLKLILGVVCVLLFLCFIFTNTATVTINIIPYFYSVNMYLFVVIILAFAFGVIFTSLVNLWKNLGKSGANRKIKQLENEINELKSKHIEADNEDFKK